MSEVDLVLITGHSGAGKSEAIAAFEDGGYFCVDNLPPRMIGSLGELFRHEGSRVERAAVVSDVRGGELALTLLTFGFKNGPPRDADLTLDVRFLPNPHYVDDLRPLTGLDEAVRAYVESGTQAGEFYGRLLPLLEFLIPAYVAEGKSHLTIAVGCTGGRHRSVTVTERWRRG